MFIDLSPYRGKKICVALSGGKDSMALVHYLKAHGGDYGIALSALNCDHCIRGEESERDSAFVKAYCASNGIPLRFFKAEGCDFKDEGSARIWRLARYAEVIADGTAELVATAHHMNDNAETVLFNLARGASLSGLTGITDMPAARLIRPLIGCSRQDIDGYIAQNNIPFVTDSTNLTDAYTRNKIRMGVLPLLESAVPGAVKNIFRFSRLAADDEEYFNRKVALITVERAGGGYLIKPCDERVIFKRAAQRVVSEGFKRKDYTAEHFEALFRLQSAENGKRFGFLGLTAVKEAGGIALTEDFSSVGVECEVPFHAYFGSGKTELTCGVIAVADREEKLGDILSALKPTLGTAVGTLRFDPDKIPQGAVIRFKRAGDKFQKFGGGTKSLGDYLTDKKVPQSLRPTLPLVCVGSEVYIIGGVEISEKVKVTESTKGKGVFVCRDPFAQ